MVSVNRLMREFPPAAEHQVSLANWRLPPFNRWAFSQVRQILPTANIARAPVAPAPFQRRERAIGRIAFQGPSGGERTVEGMLGETFTDGFLVLQRGRILAEWYGGILTPETPHIIFSVSKSVTGTLAGVLVETGQLEPEALVTRYIPEVAGSAYGDCTVRHVLDMTVSTDFVEDYLDPHGDFARYRAATGWNPVDPAKATDLRSFLATMRRGTLPHGHTFHYVSPNSDLLGWILERASGRRYAELLTEALWQPMGAEHDAYVAVERLGAARSAGGICVTLRDLGRFGELMRRRGMAEGRQVIPGSWIDDIRGNGDPAAWQRSPSVALLPQGRYRSKWYNLGNDRGSFCGIGIHGQWVYVDPASEVTIAKLSSQPLPVDDPTDFLLLAGFDAIVRALA
jgi:hypothetical protein